MKKLNQGIEARKNNTNVLTQLAGEYHVCSELCRRQILALPAPKNNPLFDVVAVKPDLMRTVNIQVKTMANKVGWILGKLSSPDPLPPNLYMALVHLKAEGPIDCYLFEYGAFLERVSQLSTDYYAKTKRDGTARKIVSFDWFDLKDLTDEDKRHSNQWSTLGF